jgi:hypothetical protein
MCGLVLYCRFYQSMRTCMHLFDIVARHNDHFLPDAESTICCRPLCKSCWTTLLTRMMKCRSRVFGEGGRRPRSLLIVYSGAVFFFPCCMTLTLLACVFIEFWQERWAMSLNSTCFTLSVLGNPGCAGGCGLGRRTPRWSAYDWYRVYRFFLFFAHWVWLSFFLHIGYDLPYNWM